MIIHALGRSLSHPDSATISSVSVAVQSLQEGLGTKGIGLRSIPSKESTCETLWGAILGNWGGGGMLAMVVLLFILGW